MKAELIQDNEVTASVESGKTVNVTIQSGSNEFTIRVTSLEDEKNYTDYNDWLDSNYLSSDFTDEEINDLYEMCMKNDSFEIEDLPF